jgi:hypothetical protein
MRTHGPNELRDLSLAECHARLRLADTGRLAITSRALPLVVPVEIDDVGDELRIRSLLGDAAPLQEGNVVALEVGTFGDGRYDEWSISVRGVLRRISPQGGEEAALTEVLYRTPLFALSTELVAGWTRASSAHEQCNRDDGPSATQPQRARR